MRIDKVASKASHPQPLAQIINPSSLSDANHNEKDYAIKTEVSNAIFLLVFSAYSPYKMIHTLAPGLMLYE